MDYMPQKNDINIYFYVCKYAEYNVINEIVIGGKGMDHD